MGAVFVVWAAVEFEKNKVVYLQGEAGRGIYYLKKGEIKVTLLSDKGDERIINMVPPGMLFGEHGVHGKPPPPKLATFLIIMIIIPFRR
ncbi:Crp/Fnr family transcriptional regulator [Mesobacillus jeotgali]|uniref:Crp/Fnr family transcriptional regulator n=1 Tax=Mesobacillus jeotgali TaxID=129985 RepID=UPI0037C8A6DE